jgi:hypothetical protein
MSTLNVQKVVLTGLTPSYGAAAAGGDEFVNSGRTFIHVKNANATLARTVTVDSQTPCSQGYDHDAVVEVPASSEKMIGPFPKDRFNDAAEKVQISYSTEADLTIAAIEVP